MSNGNDNASGFWMIVIIGIAIAVFFNALSGDNSISSSSVSSPAVSSDRSSFEHRYATERFKQEGYSAADSQKAADAVIKFHNAQKARNK